MRICDMEGRQDWKQIVESIPCPICGAEGMCRNAKAQPGTLMAQEPRNDWHQERKQLAVQVFEQQRETIRKESEHAIEIGKVEESGIGEHQDGNEGWETAEAGSGNSPEQKEGEQVTTLVPEQNIAIDEKKDDQ